ncbi:MAG: DUF5060 domain-containing protein [Candidatus Zipacnadales bacterium]
MHALQLAVADIILVALTLGGCTPAQTPQSSLTVVVTENSDTIPPYDVFELTFRHERQYKNPFHDVTIEVRFASPSGRQVSVGGFHYGSSQPPVIRMSEPDAQGRRNVQYIHTKQDLWKARFAPDELGEWRYVYTFANLTGERFIGEGAFRCIMNRVKNPGFLRQDSHNPFRWVFDDGSPYYPIGLQDCWGDGAGVGSAIASCSMEGPFRMDRADERPSLPAGPLFVRSPSENPQNGDVYFRRFSQCGFNLYRFSQQNCSYALNRDLNQYLVQEGVMTDELIQRARRYGFRFMYGIFGYQKVFNDEPDNAEGIEKVKRFIKYSVDRWGAYIDIWELLNEQKADDRWYEIIIPYLRSIDPYQHPITTSWERPDLAGIEINAPHWYQKVDAGLSADQITADRARQYKQYGKPVIVGEHGNWTPTDKPKPPEHGGVWDPHSALRMRIRNWTAFFTEIAFVFWNTSYARDGHFMNIWLGPREREYVRAMQDFAYRLGPGLWMTEVTVSIPQAVRAYGLVSEERAGVYLHHFVDHAEPVTGLRVSLDVPRAATAYWYSPETAEVLNTVPVQAGRTTLIAPEFTIDLALLITADGPPDIDEDGRPNSADEDDDNDGVADVEDAFPLDPSEWADTDNDLIGDNLDADDNGDGIGDDHNGNGTPDHEELDFDGDGINRTRCVPWDAFPDDPQEWSDTDGDGIGDNSDSDDDGDGFTDIEERAAGTDLQDHLSFPLD